MILLAEGSKNFFVRCFEFKKIFHPLVHRFSGELNVFQYINHSVFFSIKKIFVLYNVKHNKFFKGLQE